MIKSSFPTCPSQVFSVHHCMTSSSVSFTDHSLSVHLSLNAKHSLIFLTITYRATVGQRSSDAFEFEWKVAKKPREVEVAIKVINVIDFCTVTSRCEIDFYLYLEWIDPAMIGIERGDPQFKRTGEEYEQLWNPHVEINNSVNLEASLGPDMAWNFKDSKTGLMRYTQRYKGFITCETDLRRFPFDFADVSVQLGCKMFKSDKVTLSKAHTTVRAEDNVVQRETLHEWELLDKNISLYSSVGSTNYSNLSCNFFFLRLYGFYLVKVVLIQLMLSALSWTVMFMSPSEFGDRISNLLTLFLSSVAFLYVIGDKVPKVPYLTLLDKIILSNFVLLFIIAIESFAVFLLYSEDGYNDIVSAKAVDSYSKVILPAVCVLVNLLFVLQGVAQRKYLVSYRQRHQKKNV
jgi:hypothetical protein